MSKEFTDPSEADLFLNNAEGETIKAASLIGRTVLEFLLQSMIELTSLLMLRLITRM